MSASDFNGLPALLRRKQVLAITGWSKKNYYQMVEDNQLPLLSIPGFKEKRVKTLQLAAMLGIKL